MKGVGGCIPAGYLIVQLSIFQLKQYLGEKKRHLANSCQTVPLHKTDDNTVIVITLIFWSKS